MRFSVYLKSQLPDDHPRHESSRALAAKIVSAGFAVRVGQNAILLTTDGDWANIKRAARGQSRFKDPANSGSLLPEMSVYPMAGSWLPYAQLPGAA